MNDDGNMHPNDLLKLIRQTSRRSFFSGVLSGIGIMTAGLGFAMLKGNVTIEDRKKQ